MTHFTKYVLSFKLLLTAFKKTYTAGAELVVDEAMSAFTGRNRNTVFMRNKPDPWGFKIWMLADAETYFVINFELYQGAVDGKSETGLTQRVVLDLVKELASSNRIVYMDNFYTSTSLFAKLLVESLRGCGTLDKKRKGIPKEFKEIQLNAQGDYRCLQRDDLTVVL